MNAVYTYDVKGSIDIFPIANIAMPETPNTILSVKIWSHLICKDINYVTGNYLMNETVIQQTINFNILSHISRLVLSG